MLYFKQLLQNENLQLGHPTSDVQKPNCLVHPLQAISRNFQNSQMSRTTCKIVNKNQLLRAFLSRVATFRFRWLENFASVKLYNFFGRKLTRYNFSQIPSISEIFVSIAQK
jgi:hypothetical protein